MRKRIFIWASVILFLAVVACNGNRTKQPVVQETITETQTVRTAPVTVIPDSILLDTTGYVKGYETQKYTLPVKNDDIYTVTASSKNLGMIFVIQNAGGSNVTDETSSWSGELKKGNYTLIVGLTRNAARKSLEQEVKYTVRVKRK